MLSFESYGNPGAMPESEPLRLAKLLSLKVTADFDDVALARRVTEGLPTRTASALHDFIGALVEKAPLVPEATLRRARRDSKPLPREHSERLYELSRVIDAVGRVYHGDSERAAAFLTRSHPLLDGQSPLDLARSSSAGADAVVNMLRRAEAGVAL
tara:strand:+ start:4150 stop:4617 length:468 start_codon:yes stop_codon:yes gene_type:complete